VSDNNGATPTKASSTDPTGSGRPAGNGGNGTAVTNGGALVADLDTSAEVATAAVVDDTPRSADPSPPEHPPPTTTTNANANANATTRTAGPARRHLRRPNAPRTSERVDLHDRNMFAYFPGRRRHVSR
jgi:hypothetical protein